MKLIKVSIKRGKKNFLKKKKFWIQSVNGKSVKYKIIGKLVIDRKREIVMELCNGF